MELAHVIGIETWASSLPDFGLDTQRQTRKHESAMGRPK
jgi:hypothetical protein